MSEAGSEATEARRTNSPTNDDARVLVVEDDPGVADLYRSTIEGEGYEVEMVHSTEAALAVVDDGFDIALLDRRLPDGHGEDLLAEIRRRELDIRVGMVTAVDPDFDIVAMGLDLYVLKPLSNRDLIDAVQTLRSRSQYDETLQRAASLASKRATLEAEKPAAALDASAEYERLNDRLAELDGELEELTDQFDTEDYRRLFSDIGS